MRVSLPGLRNLVILTVMHLRYLISYFIFAVNSLVCNFLGGSSYISVLVHTLFCKKLHCKLVMVICLNRVYVYVYVRSHAL